MAPASPHHTLVLLMSLQLRTSTAGDIARGLLPANARSTGGSSEPKYERCDGELVFCFKDLSDLRAGKVYHDLPRNGSIGIIFRFHEPVPRSLIGDPLITLIGDHGSPASEHERIKALEQLTKLVSTKDDKLAFKLKLDCIRQGLIEEVLPLFPSKALHKPVCHLLTGFVLVRGSERNQCVIRLILQNYLIGLGLLASFDEYLDNGQSVQTPTLELLRELFATNQPALIKAIDECPRMLEEIKSHVRHNEHAQKVLDQLSSGKPIPPQVKDVYARTKIDASFLISPGECRPSRS